MKNNAEVTKHFDKLNSLGLSIFDAKCYKELILKMIQAIDVFPKYALDGDEACYNSLFIMLTVDMSVTADAAIDLLADSKEKRQEILAEEPFEFSKRLKSVRNNMHLYNKHGSYKQKADKIIANVRQEYHTDITDDLSDFRTDNALIYWIKQDNRKLCGSHQLFFEHSFERDKFEWSGEQQIKYSECVAKVVNTISELDIVSVPNVATDFLKVNPLQLESFNDKMCDVFKQLPTSEATALRLLLILTRISYALLIIEIFIDKDNIENYPEWLSFCTRWLAMHYDEAYDSLDNLLKYSKADEAVFIKELMNDSRFKKDSKEIRAITVKLRNMIHYGKYPIQIYNNENSIPEINPFRLFSKATGLTSWSKVNEMFSSIEEALRNMGNILRNAFKEKGIIKNL